jgi:hypothetical protein
MLISAFATASLIHGNSGARTAPAPLGAFAQRPLVLARPPHVAQQLPLFGPPRGRR